jgi:hypothetical protein
VPYLAVYYYIPVQVTIRDDGCKVKVLIIPLIPKNYKPYVLPEVRLIIPNSKLPAPSFTIPIIGFPA